MQSELSHEIIAHIASYSEADPTVVTAQTEISALGIHSQEVADIVAQLAERYGLDRLHAGVWHSFSTISEIVDAVGEVMMAPAE